MDISWEGIIDFAGAAVLGTVSYFVKRNDNRLDRTENDMQLANQKLNDHMLSSQKQWTEAEQRYAKEESVQQTLARLHDRLDNTATKDDVTEVRNDIKTILREIKK